MLSDEDCLRKLSAQVLNEASHLTQLNCVLNTLKKIRWKHLKFDTTSIEQLNDECLVEEDENEDANAIDLDTQLDYILDVIRDVFVQHKFQISDQLSEVHKLMSISCDDDLLAHLQEQNFELHQEINKLKADQQLASKEKRGAAQVRKLNSSQADKKVVLIGGGAGGEHHHILTGRCRFWHF